MATKLRTPYNAVSPRVPTNKLASIPVGEKIAPEQVLNNAGGFVYEVGDWAQLDRFVILGTEGGTYYVNEAKLTRANAAVVEKLIKSDGPRVVRRVAAILNANRAPKIDPGLFVLAMAAGIGDAATKQTVREVLPTVARIGTHIFTFVEYVQQFRGWGRTLRDMVADWYTKKDASKLALQVIKYQQRNGWSHRDLLRLSHAKTDNSELNDVLHWTVKGWPGIGEEAPDNALRQIWAFEKAKRATTAKEIVQLIQEYELPRECIPTQFLKERVVWDALLQNMPMTAMVRNLATMSRVGLLTPMSEAGKIIVSRLDDEERVRKSRMHPIQFLSALRVYSSGGRGIYTRSRNTETFDVDSNVTAALDRAFTTSFGNVEPSGKRTLLALDVSASMDGGVIAGVPGLTPRDASCAMALVTARSEWANGNIRYPLYHAVAFTTSIQPFPIMPTDSLSAIIKRGQECDFGGTDCSAPMKYALQNKMPVDTFVVYTDSETWAGGHPSATLRAYRSQMGIDAKLIVVGLTSSGFTIADPKDRGMLDVVGFDAAAPRIISEFSKGEL